MDEASGRSEAQSTVAGNVNDNTGNVAVGSGINQSAASINLNLNIDKAASTPSTSSDSPILPKLISYDGRSELLQLEIAEISPAEKKRLLRLSHALKGSRCLLLDAEALTSLLAVTFSLAIMDGLDRHYNVVCWLTLPAEVTLKSLAPLYPLIGLSTVALQSKNPIAQAITIARALRHHPALLVLQGFDEAQVKSLPPDFSMLLELANEDEIGLSSIIILSTRASLASRWGAKLAATSGY